MANVERGNIVEEEHEDEKIQVFEMQQEIMKKIGSNLSRFFCLF